MDWAGILVPIILGGSLSTFLLFQSAPSSGGSRSRGVYFGLVAIGFVFGNGVLSWEYVLAHSLQLSVNVLHINLSFVWINCVGMDGWIGRVGGIMVGAGSAVCIIRITNQHIEPSSQDVQTCCRTKHFYGSVLKCCTRTLFFNGRWRACP